MYETIFSLTGMLAMAGWLALVVFWRFDVVDRVIARLIIPAIIAVAYVWLMAAHIDQAPDGAGFNSLAGVKSLFTIDALLLGGWIHYLAFDLFVGSWEVEDAKTHQVPYLLVLPCLLGTFMAGPAGLGAYLLVRGATTALRPAQNLA